MNHSVTPPSAAVAQRWHEVQRSLSIHLCEHAHSLKEIDIKGTLFPGNFLKTCFPEQK